jgi:hypothetical protein
VRFAAKKMGFGAYHARRVESTTELRPAPALGILEMYSKYGGFKL